MAFPILNAANHECSLPSNNKIVRFRPYLVKEEREILQAVKSEDSKQITNCLRNIINRCVDEENFDCFKLPNFDVEYLFLQLRSKSVGETVEFEYECTECKHKNKIKLDLSIIKPDTSSLIDNKIRIDSTKRNHIKITNV